jgi:competence protein ComEC
MRWLSLALAVVAGAVLLGWPLRRASRGWHSRLRVVADVGQGDTLVAPTGAAEDRRRVTGPATSMRIDRGGNRWGAATVRRSVGSDAEAVRAEAPSLILRAMAYGLAELNRPGESEDSSP